MAESKVKYIIVEDEVNSRELLLRKIQLCNIQNITCIGLAANANEALLLARLSQPDFIFLDINLPGQSGFDLIKKLSQENIVCEIIFTSAHTEPEILLNALKNSPVTYLVKPIDLDELEESIRRVCRKFGTKSTENDNPGKICLKGSQGPVYISLEDLVFIRATAHHVYIVTDNNNKILIHQSISDIEKIVQKQFPKHFIRPDRSTIINLNKIVSLQLKKKECVLKKGDEELNVKISSAGLKKVVEAMRKS